MSQSRLRRTSGLMLALLLLLLLLLPASAEPEVVTKGWRRTEQAGRVVMVYRYPQLRGLANAELESAINRILREAGEPGRMTELSPLDGIYDLQRTFRIGRLDDRYLSVSYTGWGHFRGNSSSDRFATSRTIDLRTGRVLELSDLFWPGSDYLGRLKTLTRPMMAEWMGTDPGSSFFRRPPKFWLTPRKLVLYDFFADHTDHELALEANRLSDLAAPDGPLAIRR